tara:strand:- start:217 stop:1044 length:828 start_codon:yes stop_codon:yes gene_type:complete
MNLEELDLTLSNYNLKDILNLFKLPDNFTKDEFKDAKQIVYAIHPDKSRLDKKYFIFFLDAYKLLLKVAEFKFRKNDSSNEYYSNFENIRNDFFDKNENKIAKEFTSSNNFNDKFNELFNKHYIPPDDSGYGDWLKSNEEIDDNYERRKKESRAITLNDGIETYSFSSSIGHSISSSTSHGQSDLKDVYTTGSVIGVSEEDLNSIRIYNSVDELRRERSANITPADNATNEKKLRDIKYKEDIETNDRIYNLVVEEENNVKKKQEFWANLKQLRN